MVDPDAKAASAKVTYRSLREVIEQRRLPFTEQELIDALANEEARLSDPGRVALPAADQEFWDRNAGIRGRVPALSQAAAANTAARLLMDARALSADEAAAGLGVTTSTIRRYRASRKLYAYDRGDRTLFPSWQFMADGKMVPHLDKVLTALPAGLHPQSVAGFFLTPQPDLPLDGHPVSCKEWLERGGPVEPVLRLAEALGIGI